MEEGFLIDRGHHNSVAQPEWTAGQPQKTWLGIRVKGDKYPATTYRCPRCGLLQSYARTAKA